jgi:DNA-binding response OmpR family regulator
MRRVLILGDERLAPFRDGLEADGYLVTLRPPVDGGDAGDSPPDVVVVDLSVGPEAAEVRDILDFARSGEGPAVIGIVDTNHPEAFDPAMGLDDFVLSNASPGELALRLRSALWRRTGVDAQSVLRAGELEMDLANYTVHVGGKPVELTFKEYELLRFLATNADRVFNRETLLNKVWGYDFYGGARTVDVHIRRLRSKIEDRHRTFIETVRNVGYRFRKNP